MGQTSNPTLRYPDGTDRPRAVQIKNLAEDAHAAFLATQALINAPWQNFNPLWTSQGGAPSIGNGTLVGRYRVVGRRCDVLVRLERGSTTNIGTGEYSWTLPVNSTSYRYITGSGVVSVTGSSTGSIPVGVIGLSASTVGINGPGGRIGSGTGPWGPQGYYVFQTSYEIAG